MRRSAMVFRMCLFFVLMMSGTALAQTDEVRILRIDTSAYPTIRVYLRVMCNGVQQMSLNTADVSIVDNQISRAFSISCPTQPQTMSVAFALDRSGSVAGTSILMIKEGARQFVSLFRSFSNSSDEGALISFADDVTLDQPMTTDKLALIGAINSMIPLGYTSMWDGAMVALRHVVDSAKNPRRAVLLLSDGYDNMSTATRTDVIQYARNHQIPIYTIGVTYEDTSYAVRDLRAVADSTGGKFFPVFEPAHIVDAYNAIASLITEGLNDCVVEYQVDCADGQLRTVTVSVRACGTTVTKTQTYRAKVDPTLPAFRISVPQVTVYENSRVRIPVMIYSGDIGSNVKELQLGMPMPPPLSSPAIILPPHFGARIPLNQWFTNKAVYIGGAGSAYLQGMDTLAVFEFDVGSVGSDTTINLPLTDFRYKIDQCQLPSTGPGLLRILKRPVLGIQCIDTVKIAWDRTRGTYATDTLKLTVNVRNPGAKTARNLRARVTLPYGFELLNGSNIIPLAPSTLQTNEIASGTFFIRITPTDSARNEEICIEAFSDSSAITRCCTRIITQPGMPKLKALCDAPVAVRWDAAMNQFVPNPFPVSFTVTNLSSVRARDVTAWIHVPEGFDVDSSTPVVQTLSPSELLTNENGNASWLVRAFERATGDTVTFCMKAAAGGDTVVCCVRLYISASPVRVQLACATPDLVVFDEDNATYSPQQFDIVTVIRNTSTLQMTTVRAKLTVGSPFELAGGEQEVKSPPGSLIQSGDTVSLRWRVVAARYPSLDSVNACIAITADNFPGTQCCRVIRINRIFTTPQLQCTLMSVDSVRFNGSRYEPSPLVLTLRVKNIGTSAGKNVFAALLQGADLSIDSNDVALKLVKDSLAAGAEVEATFRLRVLPRPFSRFDTVRISVYALNGGATLCSKIVFIEGVRNPALSVQCQSADWIEFIDSLNAYVPSPFPLTVTVRNTGTADASNVTAEFLTAPGFTLAAGEQAIKQVLPALLQPNQSGSATFLVDVVPHALQSVDTVRVRVTADGGYSGATATCARPITVRPVRKAQYRLTCTARDTLRVVGAAYQPDPLRLQLLVENIGDAMGYDITVILHTNPAYSIVGSPIRSITRLKAINGSVIDSDLLSWDIRIAPRLQAETLIVCMDIVDRFNNRAQCCARIFVPAITAPPEIQSQCITVDTLRAIGDDYPIFSVMHNALNVSSKSIDTARFTIVLPPGVALDANESFTRERTAFKPSDTARFVWRLRVIDDTISVATRKNIRIVSSTSQGIVTCDVAVIVLPKQYIDLSALCTAEDSVKYIDARLGLQPSPFIVMVRIFNRGNTPLSNLSATIQIPANCAFDAGESQTKNVATQIPPGGEGSVSWSIVPLPEPTASIAIFSVTVMTEQGKRVKCESVTSIDGVPVTMQFRLTKDNLVQVGHSILVPMFFASADVSPTSLDVTLSHDPRVLDISGVEQANSHTAGWQPLRFTREAVDRVRIQGSGVTGAKEGTLVHLRVNGVVDGTVTPYAIRESLIRFISARAQNSVSVSTVDGSVTVSGACVTPLRAGERYALKQNRPNPFNPSTQISFTIPQSARAVDVELIVLDHFGRRVATLVREQLSGGTHTVEFDASTLPSGVYLYRLQTPDFFETKKMLLAR